MALYVLTLAKDSENRIKLIHWQTMALSVLAVAKYVGQSWVRIGT